MNQDSKNHRSGLLSRARHWLKNLLTDMAAEWAARAILYGAVIIIAAILLLLGLLGGLF